MRIGIISDVHSNLFALETVFERMEREHIDEVYCLGDIVGYGAQPNECVALVRDRCSRVVRGNHDLVSIDPARAGRYPGAGRAAAAWTHKQLTEELAQYLAWLPFRHVVGECTLTHASPLRPTDWTYVHTIEIAKEQFAYFETAFCFIGHTHVPSVCGEDLSTFVVTRGRRFLINPGSVGQPRDGDSRASFGILDTEAICYENIRCEYPVELAARSIIEAGLPESLARRLSMGA